MVYYLFSLLSSVPSFITALMIFRIWENFGKQHCLKLLRLLILLFTCAGVIRLVFGLQGIVLIALNQPVNTNLGIVEWGRAITLFALLTVIAIAAVMEVQAFNHLNVPQRQLLEQAVATLEKLQMANRG